MSSPGENQASSSLLAAIPAISLVAQEELFLLHQLARSKAAESGVVVDLGTFRGGSAICLALGLQAEGSDEKVYTIDSFLDSDGYSGTPCSLETRCQEVRANAARFGVQDLIELLVGDSAQLAQLWRLPVKLLFYDASTQYSEAGETLCSWKRLLTDHSLLIIHDYYASARPCYGGQMRRTVQELLRDNPDLQLLGTLAQTALLSCGDHEEIRHRLLLGAQPLISAPQRCRTGPVPGGGMAIA